METLAFSGQFFRQRYFERLINAAGFDCHLYESIPCLDPKYSWNQEKDRLAEWLEQLPQPIGIMACYDIKAQQILDICRELDIAIPEQVAVIGVDNDRLLCDLADPPLSSVICNTQQTGYEAASLLDRLMSGEQVSTERY